MGGAGVTNASLSTGQVNAYLYGLDVFQAPITTCGETQIDVLGYATGILDAMMAAQPSQIWAATAASRSPRWPASRRPICPGAIRHKSSTQSQP